MISGVLTYLFELHIIAKILLAVASPALFLFVALTLYIAHVHRKYAHLPGPPYHSFYLGHLPEIRAYRAKKYVSHLFLDWAEEYGPCYKVFILHRCMVSVNSVELIKEFLTKSKYPKSVETYSRLRTLCGSRFLGTGILTETDHSKWHDRRMVINPAFHKKYLRMFMKRFNSVGDHWIEVLRGVADGSTMFHMHDYLCRVTLDAISEVAFNYKMNAVESQENAFIQSILYALQGISKSIKDPLFEYRGSEKEFRDKVRAGITFLREDFGRRLLHDRVHKMETVAGKTSSSEKISGMEKTNGGGKSEEAGLSEGEEELPEDILTYIIRCKELNVELTDDDLLDDLMTLFIAGQETTSNALSFLFLEIGRRPEVILRIQEEVDSVLEGREFITYDDLTRLEYVGQVFKETLRLYPPASGTSRNTPTDVIVDDFRIPAGSFVVTSFFVAHRLSRNFADPEEFRPERFDKSETKPLFKYMPFSIGHRSCIGQQFATMEAKLLIAKFFQHYTLTLDPDQSYEILETATLRPQSGCRMTIAPR